MKPALLIRCPNCGTELDIPQATLPLKARCPICEYPLEALETLPTIKSVSELETQLRTLLDAARMSDLDHEDIIQILHDELEFACELGNPGRRIYVQILDLGNQEGDPVHRPPNDRRTILHSRSVGHL